MKNLLHPFVQYHLDPRTNDGRNLSFKHRGNNSKLLFSRERKKRVLHEDRTLRRHLSYIRRTLELRKQAGFEAKRSDGNARETRESHSETRVSRAGGVIPRSRGPSQDTSAKRRRERGSSGFVRFRRRSALPDTPGRRSSRPTRDERPRQSARPTDASATPNRKVPFSLRSRCSSLAAARASCSTIVLASFLRTGSNAFPITLLRGGVLKANGGDKV